MKKKITMLLALPFAAGVAFGQQLVNLGTLPSGQDAVRSIPGSTTNLNRLGHLQSGTWNSGWGTWSSLGTIIPSTLGNTPNDPALYGLTVNTNGDRGFFGTRNFSSNKANTIIAWGDDNFTGSGGDPDRCVFEFHDSNGGASVTVKQAMVMMPDPSNTGVFVGVGTYTPTEQLHTTQGVRHQGMVTGAINNLVGIDASGKLWRAPLSTSMFGGPCSTSPAALPSSWEIPMATFNYVFSGQGINSTNVGIGTNCTPAAKLHVNQSSGSTGGSIGMLVENNDIGPCSNATPVIGIKSTVNLNNSANTVGDQYRIGGWFEVPNPNNCGLANDYALYVPQNGGRVSIGYPVPTTTGALMDVNGTVQISGNLYNNATLIFSDRRFKNNIKTLENISEKINKLNGYTYDFRVDEFKSRGFDNKTHIGLIAQEVKEVFPELVSADGTGFYAVDYQGMIPVLLMAVKEQQLQIETQNKSISNQQKQIDELKTLIQSLIGNSNDVEKGNTLAINLSDKNTIVLNQNVPNPFAESTIISYNIPSDFSKAQIIFTANDGKIIKAVDVNIKGEGRLSVFANDLSSGMYSYSLVIDGKTIDTKKMIKE